jgi:hypothetical protein
MRAASSTLCETISSVSCWRWQTSCTSVSISWRSAGSSAEKGSSSSSTGCSRTRQRASATRWRWPPESSPGSLSRIDPHLPGNRLQLLALRVQLEPRMHPQRDVLPHGQMGKQVVFLKQHRYRTRAGGVWYAAGR